jgi:hypothetical protein
MAEELNNHNSIWQLPILIDDNIMSKEIKMEVKIFSCLVHAYKRIEDLVMADAMAFLCNAPDEESAEKIAMEAAERNFSEKITKGYHVEIRIQRVDLQNLHELLRGKFKPFILTMIQSLTITS